MEQHKDLWQDPGHLYRGQEDSQKDFIRTRSPSRANRNWNWALQRSQQRRFRWAILYKLRTCITFFLYENSTLERPDNSKIKAGEKNLNYIMIWSNIFFSMIYVNSSKPFDHHIAWPLLKELPSITLPAPHCTHRCCLSKNTGCGVSVIYFKNKMLALFFLFHDLCQLLKKFDHHGALLMPFIKRPPNY